QYHSCSIDLNGDVVSQMAEVVGHLSEHGLPPLPETALELLRAGHTLIKDYSLPQTPAPVDDGHMIVEDLRIEEGARGACRLALAAHARVGMHLAVPGGCGCSRGGLRHLGLSFCPQGVRVAAPSSARVVDLQQQLKAMDGLID